MTTETKRRCSACYKLKSPRFFSPGSPTCRPCSANTFSSLTQQGRNNLDCKAPGGFAHAGSKQGAGDDC